MGEGQLSFVWHHLELLHYSLLVAVLHTPCSKYQLIFMSHHCVASKKTLKFQLADLIRAADLVIWNEAPMQSRHIHEAVDHTFQDVWNSDCPFGLCVAFGGDVKQILPVVIKGNQAQIVGISMQHSTLWQSIQVLKLIQNMRFNTADEKNVSVRDWSPKLEAIYWVGNTLYTWSLSEVRS